MSWVQKGWLVDEETFESLKEKIKIEEESSGLKKFFGKIFSKSDKEKMVYTKRRIPFKDDAPRMPEKRAHNFGFEQKIDGFISAIEGKVDEHS
jgi:hypothetical protein